MMLAFMILTHSAPAGEVFVLDYQYNIYAFEPRMPSVQWRSGSGYLGVEFAEEPPDLSVLAYDPVLDEVYAYFDFQYLLGLPYNVNSIFRKNPAATYWIGHRTLGTLALSGLSYDPQEGVIGFAGSNGISPPNLQALGHFLPSGDGDYVNQLGIHVIVSRDTFYGFLPGLIPWELAAFPQNLNLIRKYSGYDSDLQVFWVGTDGGASFDSVWYEATLGFNPENWEVVAKMYLPANVGLAGSRDNVPFQLPTLLVTGDCPGTMYVTLADGTPGDEAVFMSGVVERSRTVRGGPCAGATAGLANPREQARLTVGSNGLASTSFTAAPEHCGVLKIQAMDTATCTLTEVRTVETAVVPFDMPPGYY